MQNGRKNILYGHWGKNRDKVKKKKILFICTHNSARSQIAEALLNNLYREKCEAHSAGTEASTVNPYAIEVMAEMGIDISKQRSKSIEEFKDMEFDYVVTVCDHAKQTRPFFPGKTVIHKSFEDLAEFNRTEAEIFSKFRKTRNEIKKWIEETFGD